MPNVEILTEKTETMAQMVMTEQMEKREIEEIRARKGKRATREILAPHTMIQN